LEALGSSLGRIRMERRDNSLEKLEQAMLEVVQAVLPELLSEVVEATSSSIQLRRGGVVLIYA